VEKSDLFSIITIDSELDQIQDLDLLLERTLLEARKIVHADAGSIYVREKGASDNQTEKLVIKYSQNDTQQKKLPPGQKLIYAVFSIPINDKSVSGYCALKGELINVPDAYHIEPGKPYSFSATYDLASGYQTVSILTVPLITAEKRLFGVMQMINKIEGGRPVPFTKDDEILITHFASTTTSALQRAFLTRTMILRMIKMTELRDPLETGTHANRVASYAVELYDRWAAVHGVPEREREGFRDTLRIAAMLHDVGKVAISDTILKKPSRFTEEEFTVMQQHPLYGAMLFEPPESPLDIVSRDIALTHHENWNGTGYPSALKNSPGLRGTDIPLAGRIVAVADVFDALGSKRAYKEAWDEENVLKEMRAMAGVKFDPELVDIFFEVLPNLKQIRNLFLD
jgi:HD-GYP domain-containing protein (c-di-GMP phosphodiesterase class II)